MQQPCGAQPWPGHNPNHPEGNGLQLALSSLDAFHFASTFASQRWSSEYRTASLRLIILEALALADLRS